MCHGPTEKGGIINILTECQKHDGARFAFPGTFRSASGADSRILFLGVS